MAVSSDKTLCIPAVAALSVASNARLNKTYTQHGAVRSSLLLRLASLIRSTALERVD